MASSPTKRLATRILRSSVVTGVAFLLMLAFPPVAMLGDWGGVTHGYLPCWRLFMPPPFSGALYQVDAGRLIAQVLVLLALHGTYVVYAVASALLPDRE